MHSLLPISQPLQHVLPYSFLSLSIFLTFLKKKGGWEGGREFRRKAERKAGRKGGRGEEGVRRQGGREEGLLLQITVACPHIQWLMFSILSYL